MRKNENHIEIPNLHGSIERNQTTKYLSNCLEFQNKAINFSLFKEYGFLNMYVSYEEDIHDYREMLFVLFNPSVQKLNDWFKFYELYGRERLFINDLDVGINLVVVIFRLPNLYKKYSEYLLKGQYSKFSIEYAKKFVTGYEEGKLICHPQYYVITRNSEYRKKKGEELGIIIPDNVELDIVPKRENETLSLKSLKI